MASSRTGKSLSNTTMNLRFMKNAVRSQVDELPQAKVKDDGEWEVSQAVRDAWGLLTTDTTASRESNIHEDSYLPFLFGQVASSGQSFKGRRVFGKNGEEEEVSKAADDNASATTIEPADTKGRKKIHPRPVTLSGNSSGGGFLRGFDQLEKQSGTTGPKKTAKQMVFESGTIDSDLRAQLELPPVTTGSASLTPKPAASSQFLKPAGVDEPNAALRGPKTKRKREVIDSARERPKKSKRQSTT